MAPRRRGRGLVILGVLVLVAGLIAMASGFASVAQQGTAEIPPNASGTEYFTEFSWSVLAGGTVSGTFTVLNGTPVTLFVFNDADYNSYVHGQNLTGMYTDTASSGSIDLAVSGFNTYHVVFAHAPGTENLTQDVSIGMTSTGINPGFFLGGLAAAVLGVGLAVFGVRRMRRSSGQAPSGVLQSRATYMPPPTPPPGPDTSPTGGGVYEVPPPLPGTADTVAGVPTGNIVVTLENRSAAEETVQLFVNGVVVTSLSLPPGTWQVTTLAARLASPFGSMVTVAAVTSGGRRSESSVFVGARGTAPLALRIG